MADLNLDYFKKRLIEERERILKNIREVSDELATIAAEDEIDDIEDLAELKIENDRDKEILRILMLELKDVNDALKKIAVGRYGIDEESGKKIPINRLLANPAARTA
ncbi:conjugal transfer protein TraR [Hydrogenimonas sp.]